MDIIINKELQSLLPPLTPEEHRTLEESLLVEGCRDPLIVWNNTLVDGHNRFEICGKHGISYHVDEIEAESIEDIKIWIIDNQKGRRNLTDGWKFELAQVRKEILLKQGREKQSEAGKLYGEGHPQEDLSIIDKSSHNTQKEIAEELDITPKTVEFHITQAMRFLKQEFEKFRVEGMIFFYLFIQGK